MNRPILILVRGLPGSGKTYVAKKLETKIVDYLGKNIVTMLDPDAIDYESRDYVELSKQLTADNVELKFHPYRYLRTKAQAAITANKIIIWNQPFTDFGGFNRTIVNLRDYAAERQINLPILVIEVEIDPLVAKQRVLKRKSAGGHGPSEDTFNRFINDYTSFAGEGHETLVINGEDDADESAQAIFEVLENI